MALSRITTWNANDVLTAAALNAEFNNILNNPISLISPLTAALAAGGQDITGLDELAFDDAAANATAAGRLRRNANNLTYFSVAASTLNDMAKPCEGRLTLTTAVPVTTADVTAATTVYFTPYKGNKIALFDGTATWNTYTLTEVSVAVPATTSTMYDVFIYDSAGTLTLDATAWTNDTTRATALATQNGVLVKTGATNRRYIGSFRTTGVSGQTEDSSVKRYVWNYYNRVRRFMKAVDTTDTWSYNTSAYRQANANTANQLDFVIGVSEDSVSADVYALALNSVGGADAGVGVGVDSTTVDSSIVRIGQIINTFFTNVMASYKGFIAAGRHTLVWLENGAGAGGTTTWRGDAGVAFYQTGIIGELMG
jgi:hypothetical protein